MKFGILRDSQKQGLKIMAAGDAEAVYRRIFQREPVPGRVAQIFARDAVNHFLSPPSNHILFAPLGRRQEYADCIFMDLNVALELVRGAKNTTVVSGLWPSPCSHGPCEYRFVVRGEIKVEYWAKQTTLLILRAVSNECCSVRDLKLDDFARRKISGAKLTRAILEAVNPTTTMTSADSIIRSIAWARVLGLGPVGDAVWVSVPRSALFSSPPPECRWATVNLQELRPYSPSSSTILMKIDAAEGPLEYVRFYYTDSEGHVVEAPQPAEKEGLIGHTGCDEAVIRAIIGGAAIWALDSGNPKNRHSKRYYIGSWKDFADIVTKAVSKPSFGFFARIEGSGDYVFEDMRGHAYEVVLGERMTAVYMDIDGYLDTNPEFVDAKKREALVWAVIRTHLRMLQRVYGDGLPKDLNEKDYHIYDSSSKDTDTTGGKMSFHIILKRVFFANNVVQAEFMKKFHHYLVEVADRVRHSTEAASAEDLEAAKIVGHGKDGYSDSLIDFSVYKTEKIGQLWRGCHSSKAPEQPFGKSRVLRAATFNHAPFENDTDAGQVLTSMVQRPPLGDYDKIDFIAAAPSDVDFVRKIPQHAFLTDEERRQLGVKSLKRKAADSNEDQEHSPKHPANQSTGSFTRVSPQVEELFRQFLLNWRQAEFWRKTLIHRDCCHVKMSNDQLPSFIIDLKGKNQPCILRAWTEDECKRAPGPQGSTIHSNALVYFFMNYNKYEEKWQIIQSCKGQCKSILQAGGHSTRAVLGIVPDEFMDEVLDEGAGLS